MTGLRITFDGKLVLTTAQAAARHGMELDAMRQAVKRLGIQPVTYIDGRTPVYVATDLDRVMKARPGKGANLRADAAK